MATVKITMRKTAAGPDGPLQVGRTYDVRPELASAYVSEGAAEFVGRPAPEQAVRPTGEAREEPESEPEPKPKAKKKTTRKGRKAKG